MKKISVNGEEYISLKEVEKEVEEMQKELKLMRAVMKYASPLEDDVNDDFLEDVRIKSLQQWNWNSDSTKAKDLLREYRWFGKGKTRAWYEREIERLHHMLGAQKAQLTKTKTETAKEVYGAPILTAIKEFRDVIDKIDLDSLE